MPARDAQTPGARLRAFFVFVALPLHPLALQRAAKAAAAIPAPPQPEARRIGGKPGARLPPAFPKRSKRRKRIERRKRAIPLLWLNVRIVFPNIWILGAFFALQKGQERSQCSIRPPPLSCGARFFCGASKSFLRLRRQKQALFDANEQFYSSFFCSNRKFAALKRRLKAEKSRFTKNNWHFRSQ